MCYTKNDPIGTLGRLTHYRCRACGWMYSKSRQIRKRVDIKKILSDSEKKKEIISKAVEASRFFK